MADKRRRNVTLDPDVDAILDRVGNASEYLSRIVRARRALWMDALCTLAGDGWTGAEILAACKALVGQSARHIDQVGLALCLRGIVSTARVGSVRRNTEVALALASIANEYWTGNEECARVCERIEHAQEPDN